MVYQLVCQCGHTSTFGPWDNVANRYLGLKFKIHGKTHHGWARLSIQWVNGSFTATLTGYAYETIPNKPIIAGDKKAESSSVEQPNPAALTIPTPKPASLGLLAMGSPALSIWRRKESALAGD